MENKNVKTINNNLMLLDTKLLTQIRDQYKTITTETDRKITILTKRVDDITRFDGKTYHNLENVKFNWSQQEYEKMTQ